MIALYGVVATLLSPLLWLWIRVRAWRGKEQPGRLHERFARGLRPRPTETVLWLHAASVGETQSALPLLRSLLAAQPALHILLTTTTRTAAQRVASLGEPRIIHQFAPLDTPRAARRFLAHWQPQLVLWLESELWPQLLSRIARQRITALLINARISQRSAARWAAWPSLAGPMLRAFVAVYAASEPDAQRYRALLPPGVALACHGNLKFDAAPLPADAAALGAVSAAIGARPCWLAASTHAPEEEWVAQAVTQLRRESPASLCILAPRHPQRGDALATKLRALGHVVAQRSKGEPITADCAIYLADTLGELGLWYRLAPQALLGGSLTTIGGHNPLEPALLQCAVITGPHLQNFAEMAASLRTADAITILEQPAQLPDALRRFLQSPELARAQAARAQAWVQSQQGASALIAEAVLSRLRALTP